MSVFIDYDTLDNDTLSIFRKELRIKPNNPALLAMLNNPKKAFMARAALNNEKDIIEVFRLDIANNQLRLPYFYACCFFGKIFNEDLPHLNINAKYKGPPYRGDQESHVKQVIKHLKSTNCCILSVQTGGGKTNMANRVIDIEKLCTVILINFKILIKSWYITLIENFPDIAEFIWIVGVNDKIFKNNKNLIPPIIICMKDRVSKIDERIRSSIGLLIVDEFHRFWNNTGVSAMLTFTPKKILLLSATPDNKKTKMERVTQLIGGDEGIFVEDTTPYLFFRVLTGIRKDEKMIKSGPFKGSVDSGDLFEQFGECPEANEIITDIIENNINTDKFIVFCNRVLSVDYLSNKLNEKNIDNSKLYKQVDSYEEAPVLIGIGGKMGIGFDEANFCDDFTVESNVALLSITTSNWPLYIQWKGRCRVNDKIVIWLEHANNMYANHFKTLKPDLKRTNAQIITINYTKGGLILDDYRDESYLKQKSKKKILFKNICSNNSDSEEEEKEKEKLNDEDCNIIKAENGFKIKYLKDSKPPDENILKLFNKKK